uniref:Gustatory receptor n=1 Tax=Bombyx mori TaxID=7091 RepID=A0A8R2M0Z9_BOMMO|nr:uncharacterized protein LOC119629394 [Bombyx mori]
MSENSLEEYIHMSFSPIYKYQKFLGSNRISLKAKNKITVANNWEKLYAFLWMLAASYSIHHFISFFYSYYYERSNIIFLACSLGISMHYLTYILTITYDKFLTREADIDLFIDIQKIDRLLKLDRCTVLFKKFRLINIFLLILVTVPFISGFLIHVFDYIDKPYKTFFLGLGVTITYVDVLVTAFFITKLTLRLAYINDRIAMYNKINIPHKKYSGIRRSILWIFGWRIFKIMPKIKKNGTREKKSTFIKYPSIIFNILKCYRSITEIYSLPVRFKQLPLFRTCLLLLPESHSSCLRVVTMSSHYPSLHDVSPSSSLLSTCLKISLIFNLQFISIPIITGYILKYFY